MTSIIGLTGATGEDWYSWPVGTTATALTAVAAVWENKAAALSNIQRAIIDLDAHLTGQGALFGAVWAPAALEGVVAATGWGGVLPSGSQDDYRSALRYRRTIEGRTFDGETIVFSQDVQSVPVNDIDTVALYETRADGDGAEPYILVRVVFFPNWTKDRVVFEATCPELAVSDSFATQAGQIAASFTFIPDTASQE